MDNAREEENYDLAVIVTSRHKKLLTIDRKLIVIRELKVFIGIWVNQLFYKFPKETIFLYSSKP